MTDFQTSGIAKALEPYMLAATTSRAAITWNAVPFDLSSFSGKMAPMFAAKLDPHDSLAAGINTYDDRPLNPDEIFRSCPHFQDAAITHGQGYSQGLWMLDVLAATFTDDGRRWAHYFSKGHATYSDDETDKMYDRKVAERASLELGWPGCNAFENAGCKQCAACAYRGKIKSPLSLATASTYATLGAAATQPSWDPTSLRVSFANLPHRRWLYGTYLVRGEITILAAPGGAGKTALATGMTVELATGTEVLDERIYQASELKVLFINGEDGSVEIQRRLYAFCLAHAPLAGRTLNRLYVAGADNPQVQRLSFLQTTGKNISMVDRSGFEVLGSALETLKPDLLVLDPLVTFCGGGNMNDNAVMAQVVRELKRLATKFDCAVLVIHHTRKGAEDGNAEAISGASAIVNLARRAIMPAPMTVDDAKALLIPAEDRFRYFKLVDAKSNLAPRAVQSPWYRLHSVTIPNPEPPVYPFGDSVQAVQRVNLVQAANRSTDDQMVRGAILAVIQRGKMIDGDYYPYSPTPAGAKNQRALLDDAKDAIAAATAPRQWQDGHLKAVAEGTIRKMKSEGLIVEKDLNELKPNQKRFRKGRGLTIELSRTVVGHRSDGSTGAIGATGSHSGQLFNSRSIDWPIAHGSGGDQLPPL